MSTPDTGPFPSLALALAVATALAVGAGCDAAGDGRGWERVPLAPEGETTVVREPTWVAMPLPGVEELEIDYRSTGHLLLVPATQPPGGSPSLRGDAWRQFVIAPGPGTIRIDLRTTGAWTPRDEPALFLTGTGEFTVTGLRFRRASADGEANRARFDGAWRLAPFSIDFTTINGLDPTWWSRSTGVQLVDLLGGAFLLLTALGAGLVSWRSHAWRPAPALVVAAVATALVANGWFLVRAAPVADLRLPWDREARIREGYRLDPEVGRLAALARERIGPTERVGVLTHPAEWFKWETLCFNLEPRPCVHLVPGEAVHQGLQHVDRMPLEEVDVIVALHPSTGLPPGFVPEARLNESAFLARRR